MPTQHLTSYPMVNDSIKTFQSNPYGAKSIDLTNAAYNKVVKPTFPYLKTPVSYASPYVAKADEVAANLLGMVDEKVPIVKKETAEVKDTVVSYALWPLVQANQTKDYALGTWSSEYKKCGGDGVVAGGKAMITSSLVITSDVLTWVSNFLSAKKAKAKQVAQEQTNN